MKKLIACALVLTTLSSLGTLCFAGGGGLSGGSKVQQGALEMAFQRAEKEIRNLYARACKKATEEGKYEEALQDFSFEAIEDIVRNELGDDVQEDVVRCLQGMRYNLLSRVIARPIGGGEYDRARALITQDFKDFWADYEEGLAVLNAIEEALTEGNLDLMSMVPLLFRLQLAAVACE